MPPSPPDIVILGTEWQFRALLRAQLIEAGFDVVATDTWQTARPFLRPGMKPRLVIVDVQGLPIPDTVLSELSVLMKPSRVLVLLALGALSAEEIQDFGFHWLKRPVSIDEIVGAAVSVLNEPAEA